MITIYINQRHVVLRVENYTSLFFSSLQKKRKMVLPFIAEERGIHISRNHAASLLGKASSGNNKNSLPSARLSLIVKCKHGIDLNLEESIPWKLPEIPGSVICRTLLGLNQVKKKSHLTSSRESPKLQKWQRPIACYHWVIKCNGKRCSASLDRPACLSLQTDGSKQVSKKTHLCVGSEVVPGCSTGL